ncbi:unnamed protein product [Rhizopus stolonifer]
MTSIYSKRLTKELKELHRNPPEGVVVEEADNFLKWTLCLTGAPGSIYEVTTTQKYFVLTLGVLERRI